MKRIALYLLLAALLTSGAAMAEDTLSPEEMLLAEEAIMTDDLPAPQEEAQALPSAREEMIDGIIALAQQLYTKAAGKPQRAQYAGDIYVCKN